MIRLTIQVTISLRIDEVEVMDRLVKEYDLKRHEIIKLAIRTFLFPEECKHRLDGKTALIEKFSIRLPVSEHPKEFAEAERGAKDLANKKITIVSEKDVKFDVIDE